MEAEENVRNDWSHGVIWQIFITQSAVGRRDLRAPIQKFWNKCSNLNFKEDSLYPFPGLFRQNKLWNGAF